jgi:hypothetical protein
MACIHRSVIAATLQREWRALRVNRFLHGHLAFAGLAGLLPLLTPDDVAGATPAWGSQATLYGLSISALLLGVSSAQSDADERELMFSQPVPRGAWLAGKAAALAALVGPAAVLLVLPAAFVGGLSLALVAFGAAAAGLCVTVVVLGLAIGLWVGDHVRGVLAALALWFALVFGSDLLLLGVAGTPWIHAHAWAWVAVLMANPLDAFRVTVLFAIDDAAYMATEPGRLTAWWLAHAGAWLGAVVGAWTAAAFALALAGAKRSIDS